MPVTVVLELGPGLEPERLPRPDGGWIHPVVAELRERLPSLAGVAVDLGPAGADETAEALAEAAIASLGPDARLIDREPCTVDGHPAVRTLVLMGASGLVTVVLEQWWVVVGATRVTLTATADLAGWSALAETLRVAVTGARFES